MEVSTGMAQGLKTWVGKYIVMRRAAAAWQRLLF